MSAWSPFTTAPAGAHHDKAAKIAAVDANAHRSPIPIRFGILAA